MTKELNVSEAVKGDTGGVDVEGAVGALMLDGIERTVRQVAATLPEFKERAIREAMRRMAVMNREVTLAVTGVNGPNHEKIYVYAPGRPVRRGIAEGYTPTVADRIIELMEDGKERTSLEVRADLGVGRSIANHALRLLSEEGPWQEIHVCRAEGNRKIYKVGQGRNARYDDWPEPGQDDSEVLSRWAYGCAVTRGCMNAMVRVGRVRIETRAAATRRKCRSQWMRRWGGAQGRAKSREGGA